MRRGQRAGALAAALFMALGGAASASDPGGPGGPGGDGGGNPPPPTNNQFFSFSPTPRTRADVRRDGNDTSGPLDIAVASAKQRGPDLDLYARTRGNWRIGELTSGRSFCFAVARIKDAGHDEVCVGKRARLRRVNKEGTIVRERPVEATVVRPSLSSVRILIAAARLGVHVGDYTWGLHTRWSDSADCSSACLDAIPVVGRLVTHYRQPQVAGCTSHGGQYSNGPRSLHAVALTFDDGPSPYTAGFLSVLEREHVPATFFLIGEQVSSYPQTLHRMLRDGMLIGNHTWSHADVSGGGSGAYSQIASTQGVIRRVTGFTPCVFRPPYGATSGALVDTARSLGLSTFIWDVDPTDWSRPGSSVIYSRIIHQARNGSIILSHDGGGPRDQTLAQLPAEIHYFKRHGYKFLTLAQMFHFPMRYR